MSFASRYALVPSSTFLPSALFLQSSCSWPFTLQACHSLGSVPLFLAPAPLSLGFVLCCSTWQPSWQPFGVLFPARRTRQLPSSSSPPSCSPAIIHTTLTNLPSGAPSPLAHTALYLHSFRPTLLFTLPTHPSASSPRRQLWSHCILGYHGSAHSLFLSWLPRPISTPSRPPPLCLRHHSPLHLVYTHHSPLPLSTLSL